METPSSTKRVTRSQTLSALNNNVNDSIPISRKIEDSEKGVSKSRRTSGKNHQQDRSALIDITNDSPIVGLAIGSLETPSSAIARQKSNRSKINNTPGSGEALLRGQVKTLLQKDEEEAEVSKISLENRPFLHLSGDDDSIEKKNGSALVTPLPVVTEISDGKKEESIETEKSLTRSLLLDFSEKSEVCDSLTSEGSCEVTSSGCQTDDESGSTWSIQVNASMHDEDLEEEEEEYYEEYEDGELIDELCEGIGKITMSENKPMAAAKFQGKHKRFVYNSDDEIVEEEEEGGNVSPSILHLKGLPTPKGKHLRFPMQEEEEEEE